MNTPVKHRNPSSQWGLWIAIGIAVGAGMGVALHNLGMGIGIGLAIGIVLGVATMRTRPCHKGRTPDDTDAG